MKYANSYWIVNNREQYLHIKKVLEAEGYEVSSLCSTSYNNIYTRTIFAFHFDNRPKSLPPTTRYNRTHEEEFTFYKQPEGCEKDATLELIGENVEKEHDTKPSPALTYDAEETKEEFISVNKEDATKLDIKAGSMVDDELWDGDYTSSGTLSGRIITKPKKLLKELI